MEFDTNINYLEDAFWQIILAAGPILGVALGIGLLIGIIQAIAILPGISRSGSTISCSVLLGVKRINAAEFSFLMVLPIIFGSILKSFFEIENYTSNVKITPLITGFISAFITGIFACRWMIILVKKSKLKYFGFYCLLLGFFSIYYGIFIK